MSTAKVNFDSTDFVISHVLERGEWILPKRLEHEKQMKNGLIVLFCLRANVNKMSQMIHFEKVYAEINKKYIHFMVISLVNLKDLITLFQKMVQIMGFSAKAQEIFSPTDEVISCNFAGSLFS